MNNIDDQLVLYDAWTDTERQIIDGICMTVETPTENHQLRYFIRRPGYRPQEPEQPVVTATDYIDAGCDRVNKIIKEGHVYIIRDGHIYTIVGQKVR